MKENHDTFKGAHRIDIMSINDDTIRFVTQVLACKMLRKCRKDQVLAGVRVAVKKCIS
jgi:hypothetical protein